MPCPKAPDRPPMLLKCPRPTPSNGLSEPLENSVRLILGSHPAACRKEWATAQWHRPLPFSRSWLNRLSRFLLPLLHVFVNLTVEFLKGGLHTLE